MMLIDSHCHFDFEQFDPDRTDVLNRCLQRGVQKIIVPGVTAKTWDRLLQVCQPSPHLFPALGLHPMFMDRHCAHDIDLLTEYLAQHQVVAVGEIGLDFYLPDHDKASQTALFEQQLRIANKHDLPVILHVRKAHDLVLLLLKKHRIKGGIVHAFNGSQQQAQQYIQLGFLLGVGGTISYDKATRLRQLFSELPLSALTLETDAPDMPLQGRQATRNSPEFIPNILSALTALRPESADVIAQTTTENIQSLLHI